LVLNAQLHEAEEQVQIRQKSVKVQEGLEKEREVEATKVQKRATELRAKAAKLRKEADVAKEIAQEKSEEASKAESGMNSTESEVTKILGEEREMQRVLNQTRQEELGLERNVTDLKLREAEATTKPVAASAALMSKSTAVHAAVSQEAMQQLVEENQRLKHEKAELERQLSARKVAKEKATLKQKLKNRLALADRHTKLRKSMMQARH
jgi:hypothetical protein